MSQDKKDQVKQAAAEDGVYALNPPWYVLLAYLSLERIHLV